MRFASTTNNAKASACLCLYGPLIIAVCFEQDIVQAQNGKSIVEHEYGSFSTKALVPTIFLADQNAEFGGPVLVADVTELRHTNWPQCCLFINGKLYSAALIFLDIVLVRCLSFFLCRWAQGVAGEETDV